MPATRRSFIKTATIGGMTLLFDPGLGFAQDDCTLPKPPNATQFVPAEPKVVTRISAAQLGQQATQLKAFRDAFGRIQKLPPTDVIGWTKQIAQHCIQCDPGNASNIHYDWQFLGWHRALLYFLERILRKVGGGGDDLRLVYWDWENPMSRVLPAIYTPPNQPLFWGNRGTLATPNWPLSDDKVDVQPLLIIPDFKRFGGGPVSGNPTPAAFGGPHANVHNNFDPGDMADLQYSPRDPVFYAHHTNIDRLWSSWVAAGHSSPDFGQAKVYFYDETRTWKFVLLNDLRNETALGYRYATLMQSGVPANKVTTLTLRKTNNMVAFAQPSIETLKAQPARPFFLLLSNIRNLERLPETTRRYGIFARETRAGVRANNETGFLGYLSRVFSKNHAHPGPMSISLNIAGKTSILTTSPNGTVNLFIAPMNGEGVTSAAGIPLIADDISLLG